MISGNFYPSIELSPPPGIEMELTDTVNNLQAASFSNAYWLGWISWENIPTMMHASEPEATMDGIVFINKTDPQNANMGYMSLYYNTFSTAFPQSISAYNATTGYFEETQERARYINKLDIMSTSVRFGFSISCSYYISSYYDEDRTSLMGTTHGNCQIDSNYFNYIKFLNGEIPLTHGFQGYSSGTFAPVDFYINDISENNTWTVNYETKINDSDVDPYYYNTITLCFSGWNFTTNRDIASDDSYKNYSTLTPYISLTANGGDVDYYGMFTNNTYEYYSTLYPQYLQGSISDGTISTPANVYGPLLKTGNNLYLGGFEGTIPFDFVIGPANIWTGMCTGNMMVLKSSNYYRVYRILDPQEIIKVFSLFPRTNTDDGIHYGYTENLIYATHVSAENEFLCEMITGDLDDDVFREIKLRPWQYDYNLWANEYNEDDKPPYNPNPDEPGTDKDEGNIPLNTPGGLGATSAFVTQYVLNTTQIQEIGGSLWENLSDTNTDMWRNFWLRVTGSSEIDYSLSYTEILQYFLSLKYFPFDLSSISSSTGYTGIYVGTGVTKISTNSTTRQLYDSRITLNGGTVRIPNKWSNYLDMEPYTSASIYIPYCGTIEIPMSIISGSLLKLTYSVDLITGNIIGIVTKEGDVSYPIAVGVGSCGFDIMMTGTNGNQQISNHIQNIASKATQWTGQILSSGVSGLMSGITGSAGGGEGGAMTAGYGAIGNMGKTLVNTAADMVQNNIQQANLLSIGPLTCGASSSISSLVMPQTAFVQVRRKNPYRTGTQNYKEELGLVGYRSAYQGQVGSANGMGFVKCQNPNLSIVAEAGATQYEIEKIRTLLTAGIFT